MDFFKNLLGIQTGGKRKTRKGGYRKVTKGGAACESGEACAAALGAESSLDQGAAFADMTRAFHGGKSRRRHRKERKQRGGAADLSQAFEPISADIHNMAGTAVLDQAFAELSQFVPSAAAPVVAQSGGGKRSKRQTGGQADLASAFQIAPADISTRGGTGVLDAALAQVFKFIPNHNGGSRKGRRTLGGALGSSPVDAPGMLLRPEDYSAAYLSPQWEQENLVNPNFHGPNNALMQSAPSTGGARKKATKKGSRKTKGRKGSRKAKKASRKTHKCPRGKTYRKTYIRQHRRITGKCIRK